MKIPAIVRVILISKSDVEHGTVPEALHALTNREAVIPKSKTGLY
jgi:hypothetical protein